MDVEDGSEEWYVSIGHTPPDFSEAVPRDSLCAGNEFPDADEFPALMWDGENGPTDPNHPSEGFLMSPALLKVRQLPSPHLY
jgi:hypothetical protein